MLCYNYTGLRWAGKKLCNVGSCLALLQCFVMLTLSVLKQSDRSLVNN